MRMKVMLRYSSLMSAIAILVELRQCTVKMRRPGAPFGVDDEGNGSGVLGKQCRIVEVSRLYSSSV